LTRSGQLFESAKMGLRCSRKGSPFPWFHLSRIVLCVLLLLLIAALAARQHMLENIIANWSSRDPEGAAQFADTLADGQAATSSYGELREHGPGAIRPQP